jgi:hypothetical protein
LSYLEELTGISPPKKDGEFPLRITMLFGKLFNLFFHFLHFKREPVTEAHNGFSFEVQNEKSIVISGANHI